MSDIRLPHCEICIDPKTCIVCELSGEQRAFPTQDGFFVLAGNEDMSGWHFSGQMHDLRFPLNNDPFKRLGKRALRRKIGRLNENAEYRRLKHLYYQSEVRLGFR